MQRDIPCGLNEWMKGEIYSQLIDMPESMTNKPEKTNNFAKDCCRVHFSPGATGAKNANK